MSKMRNIRLLATSIIAGVPRSPAEGIQTVTAEEAEHLIANDQAVDAEDEVDHGDAGDGLDGKSVKDLREIAKAETVEIDAGAKKADIVAAIRAKRQAGVPSSVQPDDGLELSTDEALAEIVTTEEVSVPEGADRAGIVAAIRSKCTEADAT
jgi:hypothetical protein